MKQVERSHLDNISGGCKHRRPYYHFVQRPPVSPPPPPEPGTGTPYRAGANNNSNLDIHIYGQ